MAIISDHNGNKQEVPISSGHQVHVLRRPPPSKVITGIDAVDKLPTGTTKYYTLNDWADAFGEAKQNFVNSLDPNLWECAGEEGFQGTRVDYPEGLVGKVIAAVNDIESKTAIAVIVFAGEVLEIHNESTPDQRPYFSAIISGPQGKQKVEISGAHHIHVLRQ